MYVNRGALHDTKHDSKGVLESSCSNKGTAPPNHQDDGRPNPHRDMPTNPGRQPQGTRATSRRKAWRQARSLLLLVQCSPRCVARLEAPAVQISAARHDASLSTPRMERCTKQLPGQALQKPSYKLRLWERVCPTRCNLLPNRSTNKTSNAQPSEDLEPTHLLMCASNPRLVRCARTSCSRLNPDSNLKRKA